MVSIMTQLLDTIIIAAFMIVISVGLPILSEKRCK